MKVNDINDEIHKEFLELNEKLIKSGLDVNLLEHVCFVKYNNKKKSLYFTCAFLISVFCIFYKNSVFSSFYYHLLGVRCFIPNNYFVWEATRPISDCNYCHDVTAPVILNNASREEFKPYAYSSRPIVVKKSVIHWPAFQLFNYEFFKDLYENIKDSYRTVDEECQFLHFQSNFISLKDVFEMSEERVRNEKGEKSWYVGW